MVDLACVGAYSHCLVSDDGLMMSLVGDGMISRFLDGELYVVYSQSGC